MRCFVWPQSDFRSNFILINIPSVSLTLSPSVSPQRFRMVESNRICLLSMFLAFQKKRKDSITVFLFHEPADSLRTIPRKDWASTNKYLIHSKVGLVCHCESGRHLDSQRARERHALHSHKNIAVSDTLLGRNKSRRNTCLELECFGRFGLFVMDGQMHVLI